MCDNIIVIYCNASHKIGQLVFLSLLTATISYVRRPAIETKGTNGSRLILLDKIYMNVARAIQSQSWGVFIMSKKKFSHSFCVRHRRPLKVLKSDNLQYNKLVRRVAETNDSSTKHLMFQVLFFFLNFLHKIIYLFIFL